MNASTAVKKKEISVILDTNILQYLNCSAFLEDLLGYLDSFVDFGKTLKVSEISILEILSGCTSRQEEEVFDIWPDFLSNLLAKKC